ncbi:hypothetical protein LTR64_000691 [Lithohypha guttulata]|uniref:uncharacterized protein n=1 Tax=Lithohypha guttulata TaxID=1690604 RepID=UPI002DDF20AD|nr:hypothetical protein LTR51_005541 [Lithohypha guttulata]
MTRYGPVPNFPIKDKVVCITGGGSGIGFALAKLCHDNGARVLIGDLKLTSEAEEYISAQSNNDKATGVTWTKCDVKEWKDLHNLISKSLEVFGDVPDVYCPVAGVYEPPWSNFWDDREENGYQSIRINLGHPVKLTRLAIRALAGAKKQGVVCLVASTAGIRGNYFATIYATTKHAIMGFAKSMGQADPEEGVKVVCVMPGTVQSPLWENREDDIAKETKYSERKLMPPSTIAEVMLRMIQEQRYSGGTCLLKTIGEERVVEQGWDAKEGEYDPSPRPEADMSRIKAILEGERGKKWEP